MTICSGNGPSPNVTLHCTADSQRFKEPAFPHLFSGSWCYHIFRPFGITAASNGILGPGEGHATCAIQHVSPSKGPRSPAMPSGNCCLKLESSEVPTSCDTCCVGQGQGHIADISLACEYSDQEPASAMGCLSRAGCSTDRA